MLPVPHFHLVFTLPAQLRALCYANKGAMYDLLVRSCSSVLIKLGEEVLGAQLGVTTILHTWSRDLSYHVHTHCIVTAGGWDKDRATFRPTKRHNYLFPVARLKARFRARLLRGLQGLVQQGAVTLPNEMSWPDFEQTLPPKKRWVVHIRTPFGRFENVLAYLGRYTHRVGISDSRLRDVTDKEVTFTTRDGKTCTLSHQEFTRRFLLHVLPEGFKKIRHYGLYASGSKQRALALGTMVVPTPAGPTGSTTESDSDGTDAEATVWRDLRCPDCDVLLHVARDIPRPRGPPWRPR